MKTTYGDDKKLDTNQFPSQSKLTMQVNTFCISLWSILHNFFEDFANFVKPNTNIHDSTDEMDLITC